ncbi:hypothetical protein NDN08_003920 [Rhodosorus marinus]|uniref:Uncharacterized protein n=1 Tax=Rhodosorus marinus TaxID=101924 RepID=A0AAV8UGU9_9RHOD|nr:hypothetical protein NDN08_003920 [Rhodosorus marinus]
MELLGLFVCFLVPRVDEVKRFDCSAPTTFSSNQNKQYTVGCCAVHEEIGRAPCCEILEWIKFCAKGMVQRLDDQYQFRTPRNVIQGRLLDRKSVSPAVPGEFSHRSILAFWDFRLQDEILRLLPRYWRRPFRMNALENRVTGTAYIVPDV